MRSLLLPRHGGQEVPSVGQDFVLLATLCVGICNSRRLVTRVSVFVPTIGALFKRR